MWLMLVFTIKKTNRNYSSSPSLLYRYLLQNLWKRNLAQKLVFNIERVSANCVEKWITFGTSHTVVTICDFLRQVVFLHQLKIQMESRWQSCGCTNIYTHNLRKLIHQNCCSDDVEKKLPLSSFNTRIISVMFPMYLFCGLLEWFHPVCGFI